MCQHTLHIDFHFDANNNTQRAGNIHKQPIYGSEYERIKDNKASQSAVIIVNLATEFIDAGETLYRLLHFNKQIICFARPLEKLLRLLEWARWSGNVRIKKIKLLQKDYVGRERGIRDGFWNSYFSACGSRSVWNRICFLSTIDEVTRIISMPLSKWITTWVADNVRQHLTMIFPPRKTSKCQKMSEINKAYPEEILRIAFWARKYAFIYQI